MPQITSVEPQKKNKDRLNIFVDGHFAFGISTEAFLKNKLKVGTVLSQAEIESITKTEQSTKLMDRALNFLSYRPRSEKEIRDYLVKKIASFENIKYQIAKESPLTENIISKLKNYKYINDLEFAKWWVEARKSHPKGQIAIKFELFKKGIGREIIEKVISMGPDQNKLARLAIEKKIKTWQKLTESDFKKKFYQHLLSRGFDLDTIRETFAIYNKKR